MSDFANQQTSVNAAADLEESFHNASAYDEAAGGRRRRNRNRKPLTLEEMVAKIANIKEALSSGNIPAEKVEHAQAKLARLEAKVSPSAEGWNNCVGSDGVFDAKGKSANKVESVEDKVGFLNTFGEETTSFMSKKYVKYAVIALALVGAFVVYKKYIKPRLA